MEWGSLGGGGLTLRFDPTIIFNTKNSSPFEMNPSRSMSYTLNATSNTPTEQFLLPSVGWRAGEGRRSEKGETHSEASLHDLLCC